MWHTMGIVFYQVLILEVDELAFIEMWGKTALEILLQKFDVMSFESSKAKIFKWQRCCI
jgi:hypothetical protein